MTVITLLLTGDVGLAWGTVTDFGAGERAPRVRDPSGEVHLTSEDRTNVPGNKLTRRGFLKAAGAGAAWIALTNTRSCAPAQRAPKVRSFRSRPDLSPPAVKVATQTPGTAPGYIFVAPKEGTAQNGPMIVDDRGELVWFRPLQNQNEHAMDFKVQHYKGEPVLTWCESRVVAGHGLGEYVIVDGSYREITRLKAGNGYEGDHHEFLITPHDTSLLTMETYSSSLARPSPYTGSTARGATSYGSLAAKRAPLRWAGARSSATSTTLGASQMAPSPSLITAAWT